MWCSDTKTHDRKYTIAGVGLCGDSGRLNITGLTFNFISIINQSKRPYFGSLINQRGGKRQASRALDPKKSIYGSDFDGRGDMEKIGGGISLTGDY